MTICTTQFMEFHNCHHCTCPHSQHPHHYYAFTSHYQKCNQYGHTQMSAPMSVIVLTQVTAPEHATALSNS